MEFSPQIRQPEQVILYEGCNLRPLYELTKKVFPTKTLSESEFSADFELALKAVRIDPLDGSIDYAAFKNFRDGVDSDEEIDSITNPQILLAAALFKALKNPEVVDISGELAFNLISGQSYLIDNDGVWSDDFGTSKVLLVPSSSSKLQIGASKRALEE